MSNLFFGLLLTSMGFVGSIYCLMVLLLPAAYSVLAQQPFPDWTSKDWASLGTSGIFGSFMCWLHVRTTDRHDVAMTAKDARHATEIAVKDRQILKMIDAGYELPPSDR